MNERDKELWNEAAKDTKGDSWDAQVAFMQRFADLIRADAMEAATRAANESWSLACKKMVEFERGESDMSTITVHVIAITSVVINGILFNMWLFK